MIRFLLHWAVFLSGATEALTAGCTGQWIVTLWKGEKAFTSSSQGWRAIVSLERGRLVHFGPAGIDFNLLYVPHNDDELKNFGGHRLWLGPQALWSRFWPPPQAWESSGPEYCSTDGGVLRMVMADTGDGWPRITRTYQWKGECLVCGAEMIGGTRQAQIIHILQVPKITRVEVAAQPEFAAPNGYVLLPTDPTTRLIADFSPPAHVTSLNSQLTLRHQTNHVLKVGLRSRALLGCHGGFALRVSRGNQTGQVAAEPDQGFLTQIYLGGNEPFIELEQLSPAFFPGEPATFEIVLEGTHWSAAANNRRYKNGGDSCGGPTAEEDRADITIKRNHP